MDVDKYKNKMEYPKGLIKPFLKKEHTSEEASQYVKNLKEYEASLPSYREAKQKYREEDYRLIELFRQDAFKELGIEKHPKRDVAWRKAWEDGHSCGLSEVWLELQDLAELMVD
jgi:hypothetical protein